MVNMPAGTDGYSQLPLTGGALEMWDSSPQDLQLYL